MIDENDSQKEASNSRVNHSGIQAEAPRSEEHTSELQSPCNLVCRLLLEKKKKIVTAPFLELSTTNTNPAKSSSTPRKAALPTLSGTHYNACPTVPRSHRHHSRLLATHHL